AVLPGGASANQRSVAGAIDNALLAGTPITSLNALYLLPSGALGGALDQLSGQVHVSTASVLADESLYMRSAILGRLRQASYRDVGTMGPMAALTIGSAQAAFADGSEIATALAYAKSPIVTKALPKAPVTSDVVYWAQGFGAWGRFDGDGNAASVRRDLAGFITGVDTRVGPNGRAGFAAGYTGSRNALDGLGQANVETAHVAAYGGASFAALNLRSGAAYAFHSIDTDRTIAFPGFFDRATARYDGSTGQVFGEAGYGFALGQVALEPFAGAAWVRVHTNGAAEQAMLAGLNFAGTTFETVYSSLGLRAASVVPLDNGMVLIPRASLAWQHAFSTVTPSALLAFEAAPGTPFTIAGVPIARDALLTEAGLDLALNAHATIGIAYTGQTANHVEDHAAKGKFVWRF
ncbi:MAG: autotransporter domain-containing protein, partial [Alphaproteobacteria bacterium]|nr:autotransporter domain-containing protein [Alphaproteobacteria bacterium]